MTRLVVRSRVDSDGIVRIPVGVAEADREVQVIIETVAAPSAPSNYVAWLESIAGQWAGEFERMPVGGFETRDEL